METIGAGGQVHSADQPYDHHTKTRPTSSGMIFDAL